jgi:hypothetical protein
MLPSCLTKRQPREMRTPKPRKFTTYVAGTSNFIGFLKDCSPRLGVDCISQKGGAAMEIGTKKWHESLSDVGWEVLALAGMLLQASVLAIIIGVVMLVNGTVSR